MENSELQNDPELSKRQNRWVNKRLSRYHSFIRKFEVTDQIHTVLARRILRRMVDDHESHEAFSLHHRINDKFYFGKIKEKRTIYFKGYTKENF